MPPDAALLERPTVAASPVLEVADFCVEFRTRSGIVKALDRVAFSVARGETLALVGESGSGKSVTAYALLGLLDAAGRITNGRAMLEGTDLVRASAYPFELSGGVCQRVMIAIAVATSPALLIADEPTTGLDVTTQAVVMDIVGRLASSTGMATILITHDLALAAERSTRIAVMHAGHIVETAPTAQLLAAPRHPYTRRLVAATPTAAGSLDDLRSIPGSLPDLRRDDLPPCRFAERCERRLPGCDAALVWRELTPGHVVACWNPA